MKVKVFGKDVEIKEYGCVKGHAPAFRIPKSVNIFVKVTNACNAKCSFCSNADHKYIHGSFDHFKLWRVIDELQREDVMINRINITGGEPSVTEEVVTTILARAIDYPSIHLHLNTNGLSRQAQRLMKHERWDSISVSLHHYDKDSLSQIFGIPIQTEAIDFSGVDLNKVNASCNLIRGFIDSNSEVEKMMRFILSLGLPRLGFVALMKVNQFCKSHFVDYSEIDFSKIPNLYFTESRNRGGDCKCSNFLFNHNGRILEVYMRNYSNPFYCESSLLFDGVYFRQGFHNDNIIV